MKLRFAHFVVGALLVHAAPALSQSQVQSVSRALAWENLFNRTSGWTGADGIYSIPMNGNEQPGGADNDSTVFVFSDTFIGEVNAQGQRLAGSTLVNNTTAIIRGGEPLASQITFYVAEDSAGAPDAWFDPATPNSLPSDWYWLMDGTHVNGTTYFFGQRMESAPGQPGFQFATAGVSLLTPTISGPTPFENYDQVDTPLFAPDSPAFGHRIIGAAIFPNTVEAGALNPDGFVYVYGHQNDPGIKHLIAARVPVADFTNFSEWRYWNGSDWSGTAISDCDTLYARISSEFSVSQRENGDFILTFQLNTLGREVAIAVGSSPVGPFGPTTVVWTAPEPDTYPTSYAYNAKAHPHLSNSGELLVSYNLNTTVFADHFAFADIYRPRFINIVFDDGAANQPPVPVISSPTAGQNFPSGSTINFNGSATDPEDGTLGASTAVWTINGPGIPPDYVLATGTFSTSGTATSDGNYTVSLEVEDSQGLAGSTTTSFSVGGAGNQSPTAVAEASPTSGTVPLTVNFTGSNSSDPDGTISSYSWDFGDGGSSSSADPSHTYNSTGTFNAVLTVTDNDGATDTDQVSITVNGAGNTPPVATVTSPGDGASFSVGATVNYSGTGTDAEDGTLGGSAFTWFYSRNGGPDVQFASGVTGGSIPATAPGTYDVILEVEDSQGATDRDEVTITVSGSAKAGVLVAGLGTMEYMTLSVMPEGYKLHEPYPNPFNPTTRIAFDLPSAETVSLRIFNSLGREIRTLARDQQFGAGTHQAVWDARDNAGNRVPSGNYYLRIDADPLHAMKKLSLLK